MCGPLILCVGFNFTSCQKFTLASIQWALGLTKDRSSQSGGWWNPIEAMEANGGSPNSCLRGIPRRTRCHARGHQIQSKIATQSMLGENQLDGHGRPCEANRQNHRGLINLSSAASSAGPMLQGQGHLGSGGSRVQLSPCYSRLHLEERKMSIKDNNPPQSSPTESSRNNSLRVLCPGGASSMQPSC